MKIEGDYSMWKNGLMDGQADRRMTDGSAAIGFADYVSNRAKVIVPTQVGRLCVLGYIFEV